MSKTQEASLTWRQKFVTNPANALTTSRIVLSMVVIVLELTGHHWSALATFVVAAVTDWLDGLVAKKFKGGKYSTSWGKIFDPVADKVMIWSLMIMITVQTWHEEGIYLAISLICLLAVLAIREVDVAKLKRRHWLAIGKPDSAIQSGRIAMVMLCVAVGVLLLPINIGLWRFTPFLVAYYLSVLSWREYRRRYGR